MLESQSTSQVVDLATVSKSSSMLTSVETMQDLSTSKMMNTTRPLVSKIPLRSSSQTETSSLNYQMKRRRSENWTIGWVKQWKMARQKIKNIKLSWKEMKVIPTWITSTNLIQPKKEGQNYKISKMQLMPLLIEWPSVEDQAWCTEKTLN